MALCAGLHGNACIDALTIASLHHDAFCFPWPFERFAPFAPFERVERIVRIFSPRYMLIQRRQILLLRDYLIDLNQSGNQPAKEESGGKQPSKEDKKLLVTCDDTHAPSSHLAATPRINNEVRLELQHLLRVESCVIQAHMEVWCSCTTCVDPICEFEFCTLSVRRSRPPVVLFMPTPQRLRVRSALFGLYAAALGFTAFTIYWTLIFVSMMGQCNTPDPGNVPTFCKPNATEGSFEVSFGGTRRFFDASASTTPTTGTTGNSTQLVMFGPGDDMSFVVACVMTLVLECVGYTIDPLDNKRCPRITYMTRGVYVDV